MCIDRCNDGCPNEDGQRPNALDHALDGQRVSPGCQGDRDEQHRRRELADLRPTNTCSNAQRTGPATGGRRAARRGQGDMRRRHRVLNSVAPDLSQEQHRQHQHHPAAMQRDPSRCARAGWVSMLLLGIDTGGVQPPGPGTDSGTGCRTRTASAGTQSQVTPAHTKQPGLYVEFEFRV